MVGASSPTCARACAHRFVTVRGQPVQRYRQRSDDPRSRTAAAMDLRRAKFRSPSARLCPARIQVAGVCCGIAGHGRRSIWCCPAWRPRVRSSCRGPRIEARTPLQHRCQVAAHLRPVQPSLTMVATAPRPVVPAVGAAHPLVVFAVTPHKPLSQLLGLGLVPAPSHQSCAPGAEAGNVGIRPGHGHPVEGFGRARFRGSAPAIPASQRAALRAWGRSASMPAGSPSGRPRPSRSIPHRPGRREVRARLSDQLGIVRRRHGINRRRRRCLRFLWCIFGAFGAGWFRPAPTPSRLSCPPCADPRPSESPTFGLCSMHTRPHQRRP